MCLCSKVKTRTLVFDDQNGLENYEGEHFYGVHPSEKVMMYLWTQISEAPWQRNSTQSQARFGRGSIRYLMGVMTHQEQAML
jgi:hypothetical protein